MSRIPNLLVMKMLGLNKPLIPLLAYSAILYIVSMWVGTVWMIMPLIIVPYLYCSSVWYQDSIYGKEFISKKLGFNALSGCIPKQFMKISEKLWKSDYREMAIDHERGHLQGKHGLWGIIFYITYITFVTIIIKQGYGIDKFIATMALIIILNYTVNILFEFYADRFSAKSGNRAELINYLKNCAPKSLCNFLRLKVLK